ncbi:MAG: nitroreductase family protein [Actinomycetota bacterium]|nr:nitroreductase family protein [Actinomycetota bacterium]
MTGFMPVGTLSDQQVRSVLTAAAAAPSLHNSQPWRFNCTPVAIEIHADLDRSLIAADPDHRAVRLACGAALLNLRIAIRALGIDTDVRVLPNPKMPTLLAIVRPAGPIRFTQGDARLAAAVLRRHTNRRPFLNEPVPAALRNRLRTATRAEQAWMATIGPAQQPALRDLLAKAHRIQRSDPTFMAEWAAWTGRAAHTEAGVPARSSGPLPEQQDLLVLRDFSAGSARTRLAGKDFEQDPLVVVIGSFHDLPLAQIQAGQAMQRMLLTATAAGLSASFLSQVVEIAQTRQQLRELIGGGLWPQAVMRLGYGTPAPPTPRRDLATVVSVEAATSVP